MANYRRALLIQLDYDEARVGFSRLIIAGSDPSVLVNNPGNVGGFWPEGFTIEVRDPRSGEWTMIGGPRSSGRFRS